MTLKVYADRMSPPSRAVVLFCKLNGIYFEEVKTDLSKRQHLSPEFRDINPMKQVPAIVDGRFKLFESHAIMIYLASVFPGVADHWYPADPFKRAKVHSVLDWHHSNSHPGAVNYVFNSALAPALGLPLNPEAAAESKKLLSASLAKIESVWLKGSGRFLLGSSQPSIADLILVIDEKDREQILRPHQRALKWIDHTKKETTPHFDEVHSVLFKVKEKLKKQRSEGVGETISTGKTALLSKM